MMAAVKDSSKNLTDAVEPAVFEVIWRCYKRGETDLLDGGVAPRTIANCLQADYDAVKRATHRLENQGYLVQLQGASPRNLGARSSFAPAALFDGGEQRGD